MWRNFRKHRFARSSVVFALCVGVLAGVGLARTGQMIDSSWWLIAALGVLATIRRQRVWCLAWVLCLGLSLGWWRGSLYMSKLADFQQLDGQKITLVGRASADAVYDFKKQLSFDIVNPTVAGSGQKLTGKVGVSGFGENAVYAGDEVQVTGKLRLARGSYQARVSYAQMDIVAQHPSLVSDLRRKFMAGMQSALPEPTASFGMGLLVGQRNTLPDETSQVLLMVGLTHIIAVSGYNLTILLRASKKLLAKRSKRQSTLLALALIGIFLLFTGSSPSIVRAAIVSMLSIVAGFYGRSFKPTVLILLAAAITAYASPYYLWSDIGWYLSFLAFFGVMVLAPMVLARLSERLRNSVVMTIAVESFCAEMMAMPFILHIFGQMSFVALLSNVLVAAVIPLAMLLSLIAGLAGMLLPSVAGWFAWPAQIVLTYMLDVATLLSKIPHVFAENIGFSLAQLLVLYAAVALVSLVLYRKIVTKYGKITDRNKSRAEGVIL